jgi:hypothetical protein
MYTFERNLSNIDYIDYRSKSSNIIPTLGTLKLQILVVNLVGT